MLEELSGLFSQRFAERFAIVEPAHMELCEPSIETAYARCAGRGAERIVVLPFFLGPGKHWTHDIPRITAAAAAKFPLTKYHVARTLGIDELMLELLAKRADHCQQNDYSCDSCRGTTRAGND